MVPGPRLVLASASPRRRQILERLGIAFEAIAPAVEELSEGPPEEVVVENARRKAAAVAGDAAEGALVLGVDTDVVLDGRTLGKAATEAEARARLEALSGRAHEVLSGISLLGPVVPGETPPERSGVARSEVTFRSLDAKTLNLYLISGEWRDRAGAYAIQGLGSILVERVEGDLSNVIGLPVGELVRLGPELFRFGAGEP